MLGEQQIYGKNWWEEFNKHKFHQYIRPSKVYGYVQVFPAKSSALASSMCDEDRKGVRSECEKLIRKDPKLNEKFLACNEADREWVLDYLPSEKGVIRYEMIQRFDSLDNSSEKGSVFSSSFLI